MSLRVVHTFGTKAGTVELFDQPVVRFGRAPDNDVVFDPNFDRGASSHHAEARFDIRGWTLIDLNSRTGTYLGDSRIQQHTIAPGDEITFGSKGPRVRFEVIAAAAPAVSNINQHSPHASHVAPAHIAAAPAPMLPAVMSPGVLVAPHAGSPAPVVAAPVPPPPAALPPVVISSDVPVAPPAGAPRVGQRTIAMMISSAVAAATGRARPRRTMEISAMVDQQVSAATAGQRRMTYVLGLLLLVALASLIGIILYNRSSQDEIGQLREELAGLPPEDPRRKDIENRLGTLHPPNANFGRNLYDRFKKGIFMLASGRNGFCTAFAVRPNILATNAHCIHTAQRRGGSIVALENEGRGDVALSVTGMRVHPLYRDNDATRLTPDVGVVTIAGRAAAVLELATAQEVATDGAGEEIYLIGFPGRLMDAANPAATFLAAHIGRVTNAAGRPAPFADAWLVQHDASTTDGMSGSPIFNASGKVIAINAGGYLEGDDQTIAGQKTEVVKASPYKFGMRVDLLNAILR